MIHPASEQTAGANQPSADQLVNWLLDYDEYLRCGNLDHAPPNGPAIADATTPAELRTTLEELEEFWPRTGRPATSEEPARIGRFVIERTLGQGGFGIVYLAVDPALGRHVALKVPRLHALADAGLVERFRREARAAAALDHPNIVPVLETGQVASLYFIASSYCPGPNLAQWLKQQSGLVDPRLAAQLIARLADAVHYSHTRGVLHRDIKPGNVLLVPHTEERTDDGLPFTPRLTDFGLAKLVEQTLAEATLNPDAATATQQLLGTPAYMAPEQAGGRSAEPASPACDVYSLGAVLYELLSGRTPFTGPNIADVLHQVVRDDVTPPRRLRHDLPRDLETICLKCPEKDPQRRYFSAQQLADDLQRYLANKPIAARRPTLGYRLAKLARRHRGAVVASLLSLLLLLTAGGWIGYRSFTQRQETTRLVNEAFHEAVLRRGQAEATPDDLLAWSQAIASATRAVSLADAGSVDADLVQTIRRLATQLEADESRARMRNAEAERDHLMLAALDSARMAGFTVRENGFDPAPSCDAYSEAFRDFGIEIETLPLTDAAARIRSSALRVALIESLMTWRSRVRDDTGGQGTLKRAKLLHIARRSATDSPAWHQPLLQAFREKDAALHDDLVALALNGQMSADGMSQLAALLRHDGNVELQLKLLSFAQQQHPDDVWINVRLGLTLFDAGRHDDAIPFCMVAVALRPDTPGVWHNLAEAQRLVNHHDQAVASYRRAIELKPDYAESHFGAGASLNELGRLEEALTAYETATSLRPDFAPALCNMGNVLTNLGRPADAIPVLRRAIDLVGDRSDVDQCRLFSRVNLAHAYAVIGDHRAAISELERVSSVEARHPRDHETYNSYGFSLSHLGRLDEAITQFQKSIECQPDFPLSHYNLGLALRSRGNLEGSTAALRRAIELDPSDPDSHNDLGVNLSKRRDFRAAVAEFQRAIELRPEFAMAYSNLGNCLRQAGDIDGAIAACRRAIELQPDYAQSYNNLGLAFSSVGRHAEAIGALEKAIEVNPNYALAHSNLGDVHNNVRDWKAAVQEYNRSIELDPLRADAHVGRGLALCNLALLHKSHEELDLAADGLRRALELEPAAARSWCILAEIQSRQGLFVDAVASYRKGHELGSHDPLWRAPSASWVAAAERRVELDHRLPNVLNQTDVALTPAEQLEFAQFALIDKRQPAAAARLYQQVLQTPGDLPADQFSTARYNGACAALLTAREADAAGLSDEQRAAWRAQALDWLKAELENGQQLVDAAPEAGGSVAQNLSHWQSVPDLVAIREPDQLGRSPEYEREVWRHFWCDVEELQCVLQGRVANGPL